MSYDSADSSHILAGPSRPRFNGWLTMAPDVDAPTKASTNTLASSSSSVTGASTILPPQASTHGFSMIAQPDSAAKRRKQGAIFQADPPESLSVSSVGSVDSQGSDQSGSSPRSDSSDSPMFDVRTSFAPMPQYSKARSDMIKENGGGGMEYAGRQWKGKTVHAVEQEMEALRDESLMSHAPDATYLASRLEGLKRNLEVEAYQPTYVAYDEDSRILSLASSATKPDRAVPIAISSRANSPARTAALSYVDEEAMATALSSLPVLSGPVSTASSVSMSEGETPQDVTMEFGFQFDGAHDDEALTELAQSQSTIDPVAAKAAALDARIEVRGLRRSDLEQVRELHAFHGDSDRSPDQAETYITTASFLLRLLVDDRHVCLVAVAKPVPAPVDPLPAVKDLMCARRANQMLSISPDSVSSSSPLQSGGITPTDSLFSARYGAMTELTGATSVSGGPTQDADKSPIADLPGATESSVPLFVVKVMAAPPPKGSLVPTETVIGVISAQISKVQPPNGDSLWFDDESTPPATASIEAHLLTLVVAPGERRQGLGAKMLDALLEECQSRTQTIMAKTTRGAPISLRTYLEVHPSNHRAMDLYTSKGFERAPGEKGTRRSFYRGDSRIPLSERLKVGGTDAWVMERYS